MLNDRLQLARTSPAGYRLALELLSGSWRWLKERQSDDMGGHAESDIDRAAIAYDCFPAWYVDFDLMVVKKAAIQRKNCLVNSLLGDKEQAATVRITINHCSLTWRCHEVQQIGGQSCGGLDIYPDAHQALWGANCCDGDPGIVSK